MVTHMLTSDNVLLMVLDEGMVNAHH